MGQLGRVLLVLVLAIATPIGGGLHPKDPGGGRAPAFDDPIREDGILGIKPLRLPGRGQACLGESIPMTFAVANISPGVEVPIPVVEAMVTVRDDQGRVRALQTNGAGIAQLSWPAQSTGRLAFTVEAAKDHYVPAAPFSFQVEVIACQWVLAVDFHEEYAILSEVSLVVGADVKWRGRLTSTPGQGEDPVSDVRIAGGSGSYQLYVSDKIQAPFHFSLDPPVSGSWDLQGEGRADGSTVSLDVQSVTQKYPEMLSMKVTDYNPTMNIQVNYRPPWPTSGGNGMFLELNKLGHLTFPAGGGVVTLSSGMSCFVYAPDRTAYSLTVMLYPLKDMGASRPGSVALTQAIQ